MKPFAQAILPKLGFNRNTAREIIFGAAKFVNFQFAHLYMEQGYLAINYLLGHIHESTITSNQIMIALSYTQLVTGSGQPYLQEVETDRSYLPATWLSNIRTILCLYKGKLFVSDACCPTPQHVNNQILMDIFERRKPLKDTLEKLNAVRLYLGILTVSDITTDNGAQQIHFQGLCNGAAALMMLYRSELSEILTALYLLCALAEHSETRITKQQELFCNNAATVVRANTPIVLGTRSYMAADYDLSQEIESTKAYDIDLKTSWVKAHQDDKALVHLLPPEAQLNVTTDAD
eukprot:11739527-Ditylum_brightwellii.AAC.1